MGFVGAKSGAGVYQRIICWIPPHDLYVEPFAGTAAVFRHKRPARRSILIDSDSGALDGIGEGVLGARADLICGDGTDYLRRMSPTAETAVFVYADPPYVRATRRDPGRDYYRQEWSDADHERFLDVAVGFPGPLLISGYFSQLYADRLHGWHTEHFQVSTRGGTAEEWLWANYPRPARLHDYRYIGSTFTQRWKIHKRQRNWVRNLAAMPELERRAMLSAIASKFSDEIDCGTGPPP